MASDPIPEPLANQELSEETRLRFPGDNGNRAAPGSELPTALPAAEQDANTRLQEVAAQTGHATGRTVAAVRELPRRAQQATDEARESGSGKVEEIKSRVAEAADQARQTATETFDVTKRKAAETYRETRKRAKQVWYRARIRSHYIVNEYPLHVIAGAAAVGFVAGVLLRIWRSSRYE